MDWLLAPSAPFWLLASLPSLTAGVLVWLDTLLTKRWTLQLLCVLEDQLTAGFGLSNVSTLGLGLYRVSYQLFPILKVFCSEIRPSVWLDSF